MAAISFQLPLNMRKLISENSCMVLSDFNPQTPDDAETMRGKIMYATSGSNKFKCSMTTKDFGDDINLCPKGSMEMTEVAGWDVTFSSVAVTINKDIILTALGAGKASGEGVTEITPTYDLTKANFKSIWLVWAYGTAGGFLAINMLNALSINGLAIDDEDNGKGKFPLELKSFPSVDTPKEVPCKIYLKEADSLPAHEVQMEKAA